MLALLQPYLLQLTSPGEIGRALKSVSAARSSMAAVAGEAPVESYYQEEVAWRPFFAAVLDLVMPVNHWLRFAGEVRAAHVRSLGA